MKTMREKEVINLLLKYNYLVPTQKGLIVTNKLLRVLPEFNFDENPEPEKVIVKERVRTQVDTFQQPTDEGMDIHEVITQRRRPLGSPTNKDNAFTLKNQFDDFVKDSGVPTQCTSENGVTYTVATYSKEASEALDKAIKSGMDYDLMCKAVRAYYKQDGGYKLTLKRLLTESLMALYNDAKQAIEEGRGLDPVEVTNKVVL